MQQTNFNFDIIVHDDASTDLTQSIILSYIERYGNKIVPILQHSNKFSKGVQIFPKYIWPKLNGKYVAFCEGDDYWTDPYKLQKQYDFLEAHSDCGLVHTDCDILNETTGTLIRSINKSRHISYQFYSNPFLGILAGDYVVRTLTVMMRRELFGLGISTDIFNDCVRGDLPVWLEIANHSNFHYLPESTAVYRIVQGSLTHQTDKLKSINSLLDSKSIRKLFSIRYETPKSLKVCIYDNYYYTLLRKAYITNNKDIASHAFSQLRHRKNKKAFVMYFATRHILPYKAIVRIKVLYDRFVGTSFGKLVLSYINRVRRISK